MLIFLTLLAMNTQERKRRIVDTALQLFSENGYDKTSIRDIAKHASMSLGLLYNYFASKEQLLEAIVQEGINDLKHSLDLTRQSHDDLLALLRTIFSVIARKQNHWRLLHIVRTQRHLATLLAEQFDAFNNYLISELSLQLRQMGYQNSVSEALLLYATVDGLATHYLSNDKYPLDKVLEQLEKKYAFPVSQYRSTEAPSVR